MRHPTHRLRWVVALGALLALPFGPGCRGDLSEDPPIHLNPNMDNQERLDPQEAYSRYQDHRAMRRFPPGTVAVGALTIDDHLHRGKIGDRYAVDLPKSIRLTQALVERGRDRYNIYCASCHDRLGSGQGYVYRVNAGLPRPASFHDQRLRKTALGELFHSVTFGKANMPALGYLIPVSDRWAITTYLRALQLSRHVPPHLRSAPRKEVR
ncbi:MAG: cytochrome c [bacterium]